MMKKITEAGPIVGGIFGMAVKGKQTLPWPLNAAIDKLLFARVKQATGGRLRVSVCGGERLMDFRAMQTDDGRWCAQQGYPTFPEHGSGADDAG